MYVVWRSLNYFAVKLCLLQIINLWRSRTQYRLGFWMSQSRLRMKYERLGLDLGLGLESLGCIPANMVASKPEVRISKLVDTIGTNVQRLYVFKVHLPNETIKNVVQPNRTHIVVKWQHIDGQWSFMIDIAALNTHLLWLFKNPKKYEKKHGQRRRLFFTSSVWP